MKHKGEERLETVKKSTRKPNALTVKTINAARKGEGISDPIKNIRGFINSL